MRKLRFRGADAERQNWDLSPGDLESGLREALKEKQMPTRIASPSPRGTSKPSFPLIQLGPRSGSGLDGAPQAVEAEGRAFY